TAVPVHVNSTSAQATPQAPQATPVLPMPTGFDPLIRAEPTTVSNKFSPSTPMQPISQPGAGAPLVPISQPSPGVPMAPIAAPSSIAFAREGSPATSGASATEALVGKQDSQVSIEWVAGSMIRLNQPSTCQILVKNHGNNAVQNVVVHHRLAPTTILKLADP